MTRTAEDNAVEFGSLSKQGKDLRLALLAACSVQKGKRPPKAGYPSDYAGKVGAETFAETAKTTHDRVLRHLAAWDDFAKQANMPLAANLNPEHAVTLKLSDRKIAIFDKISLHSATPSDVKGAQTAKVIEQNKPAMKQAIKNNPAVAKAAAEALAEAEQVDMLSEAIVEATSTRRQRRSQERVREGLSPKVPSVQGPKPTLDDPVATAMLTATALNDALTALVDEFPGEWADLPQIVRDDETWCAAALETLDAIAMAVEDCRNIVNGGVSDAEIHDLMSRRA